MKRCFSLKRNKTFRYVYRKGKSVPSRMLVMIYNKSKTGMVKVGFSVSKRIGNSVTRNRIKRRLREAFPDRDVDDPELEELRAAFREAAAAAGRAGEED